MNEEKNKWRMSSTSNMDTSTCRVNTKKKRKSDKESSSKLEKVRKLNAELFGEKSFKRPRQRTTLKESFGNCDDVAQKYEKIGRLGEGTYGVVYKARDKQTNRVVALKRCLPHHENTDGFPVTTLREISILRSLRYGYGKHAHPSIVKLIDVVVSSQKKAESTNGSVGGGVFLVFEYCEFDLAHLVDEFYASNNRSPFSEAQVKNLSLQLLKGLQFLHSRNILHRDIKLSNLLYSQHGTSDTTNNARSHLRIADFGLARKSTNSFHKNIKKNASSTMLTPKVVSLWYRPPELLLGSRIYTEAIDNWGAGCAIAELLEGVPLIKGRNEMDQISKLFKLLGPPDAFIWPVSICHYGH